MYIALICSEESLPWYVMKLSEMLTKIVMIFSEILTYDCHGCLILRDSLPYMSEITMAASFSEKSLPYLDMSWNSVRCSPRLSLYSVRCLPMIAMVAWYSEIAYHICLWLPWLLHSQRKAYLDMSWNSVRCSPWLSWFSVRCLPMIAMVACFSEEP